MDFSTADLFDVYHDHIQVCDLQFRNYGPKSAFFGECVTLTAFEDHHPVTEALKAEGRYRVPVVNGGGLPCVGIIGDGAAAIAFKRMGRIHYIRRNSRFRCGREHGFRVKGAWDDGAPQPFAGGRNFRKARRTSARYFAIANTGSMAF